MAIINKIIYLISILSFILFAQEEFINDDYCGSDDLINIKSIKYPWYKESINNTVEIINKFFSAPPFSIDGMNRITFF